MKSPHVDDGPLYGRDLLRVQRALGGSEFLCAHLQCGRPHPIELFGQRQQRRVAVAAHRLDDVARRIRDGRGLLQRRALQGLPALRRGQGVPVENAHRNV